MRDYNRSNQKTGLRKQVGDFFADQRYDVDQAFKWAYSVLENQFSSLVTPYTGQAWRSPKNIFMNDLKRPFYRFVALCEDIAHTGLFFISSVPSLLISPSSVPMFLFYGLESLVTAVLDVVNVVLSLVSLVTRSLATLVAGVGDASLFALDLCAQGLGLKTEKAYGYEQDQWIDYLGDSDDEDNPYQYG